MGLVTKPYIFQDSEPGIDRLIKASEVNADFDTLYNLVNGNLDEDNLKNNSIGGEKLKNNSISSEKISNVDGSKINNNSILSNKITDLVGNKIVALSIPTTALGNGIITKKKINSTVEDGDAGALVGGSNSFADTLHTHNIGVSGNTITAIPEELDEILNPEADTIWRTRRNFYIYIPKGVSKIRLITNGKWIYARLKIDNTTGSYNAHLNDTYTLKKDALLDISTFSQQYKKVELQTGKGGASDKTASLKGYSLIFE
jgi:hypothetical protein